VGLFSTLLVEDKMILRLQEPVGSAALQGLHLCLVHFSSSAALVLGLKVQGGGRAGIAAETSQSSGDTMGGGSSRGAIRERRSVEQSQAY
jgi:hypothetical protein